MEEREEEEAKKNDEVTPQPMRKEIHRDCGLPSDVESMKEIDDTTDSRRECDTNTQPDQDTPAYLGEDERSLLLTGLPMRGTMCVAESEREEGETDTLASHCDDIIGGKEVQEIINADLRDEGTHIARTLHTLSLFSPLTTQSLTAHCHFWNDFYFHAFFILSYTCL
jgi:hypothetical protein